MAQPSDLALCIVPDSETARPGGSSIPPVVVAAERRLIEEANQALRRSYQLLRQNSDVVYVYPFAAAAHGPAVFPAEPDTEGLARRTIHLISRLRASGRYRREVTVEGLAAYRSDLARRGAPAAVLRMLDDYRASLD